MKRLGLVEYYSREKIIPIRQNILNLEAHRRRRTRLFQGVGIRDDWIRGKDVMEVGPGAGHNSIIIAEACPKEFILLEGNPTGMQETKRRLNGHPVQGLTPRYRFWQKNLMKIKAKPRLDLVFCEGVLSGVLELRPFVIKLASWVKSGGILFVSTVDELSYVPDTLRRILVQLNLTSDTNPYKSVAKFEPYLKRHFRHLPGMSRPIRDWIVDNAINPASNLPLLNIPQILRLLDRQFNFIGSWPRFVDDWRWYKELTQARPFFNQAVEKSYWRKCHNLLYYDLMLPEREPRANRQLYRAAVKLRSQMRSWEKTRSPKNLKKLATAIEAFAVMMPAQPAAHVKFVRRFAQKIHRGSKNLMELFADVTFQRWFGRGQQYLALEKI